MPGEVRVDCVLEDQQEVDLLSCVRVVHPSGLRVEAHMALD